MNQRWGLLAAWHGMGIAARWLVVVWLSGLLACSRREPPPPATTPPRASLSALASPALGASVTVGTSASATGSSSASTNVSPSASASASGSTSTVEPAPSASVARNPVVRERGRRLVAQPPGPIGTAAAWAGPVPPANDAPWLRRLTGDELVAAVANGGGMSVTIQVRFADGARALFKPHQRLSSSNFRAEIAAYHLDRQLGLGRVAVVVGRPLSLVWLRQQLAGDPAMLQRLESEVLAEGDRVPGALIAWHTRLPVAAEPPAGWLARMSPGVTDADEQVLGWSDLVLFDTLIDNTDRWSGGNVMTLGAGGPLIFLDNASAFLGYRARQQAFFDKPLSSVCRFRRATIASLRALTSLEQPGAGAAEHLARSLRGDPLAPVLSPEVLSAFEGRVTRVLRHVEQCGERFGEAATLL